MERLTEWDCDNQWYRPKRGISQNRIHEKIGEYEETGLEPEEIIELKKEVQSKEDYSIELYNRCKDAEGKLKDYEDMEEQGRLIKPPAKIGDIVYVIGVCEDVFMRIDDDYSTGTGAVECPFEAFCAFEECDDNNKQIFETLINAMLVSEKHKNQFSIFVNHIEKAFYLSDFGKTVFLTREETEKALQESEGGAEE